MLKGPFPLLRLSFEVQDDERAAPINGRSELRRLRRHSEVEARTLVEEINRASKFRLPTEPPGLLDV